MWDPDTGIFLTPIPGIWSDFDPNIGWDPDIWMKSVYFEGIWIFGWDLDTVIRSDLDHSI